MMKEASGIPDEQQIALMDAITLHFKARNNTFVLVYGDQHGLRFVTNLQFNGGLSSIKNALLEAAEVIENNEHRAILFHGNADPKDD